MIETTASTHPLVTRPSSKDALSAALVIVVTLIALSAGYLLRNSVETRTKLYTDPSGVTIYYPDNWQLKASNLKSAPIQVRDLGGRGFPSTLELRRVVVDPKVDDKSVLGLVGNNLAVNRAGSLSSFKLFNLTPGQTIKGLPGAKAHYVFVDNSSGVFQEGIPSVVLGDDYLVRKGGNIYIFTLQATQDNRPDALQIFDRFVESAQLP